MIRLILPLTQSQKSMNIVGIHINLTVGYDSVSSFENNLNDICTSNLYQKVIKYM